jgi:hypothetical protein
MDDNLAALVDRNLACRALGVGLRWMDRRHPFIPCAAHGPIVAVPNDMLVFACHNQLLILDHSCVSSYNS